MAVEACYSESMSVQTKRIYEPVSATDGYRILVDRLWPRGVSKDHAKVDLWLKEIAPSNELRQWFGHRPERFQEFSRRYQEELTDNAATVELQRAIKEHKRITLLYSAHDEQHNNAVVLAKILTA
jgi:uncharacterized protein YeaO (DUF488 family)